MSNFLAELDLESLSDLPEEEVVKLYNNVLAVKYDEARNGDHHAFIDIVLKDNVGKRLWNEDIHRSWWDHIYWCWRNRFVPVILAPIESGKSTHISVGLSLFELGRNPNLRITIICNDDDNAMRRVEAIQKYIEEDHDYRTTFPHIVRDPNPNRPWSKHAISVRRDSMAIDPSVTAYGIRNAAQGIRSDIMVLDDIDDDRVILSLADRDDNIHYMRNKWLGRVEKPNGRIVLIGTAQHDEDFTHVFMRSRSVCTMVQAISEDMERLEVRVLNVPDHLEHPILDLAA